MRFHELLLEYRRDKTQQRWQEKLFQEIQRREDTNSVAHHIMVEVQEEIDQDVWTDEHRAIYQTRVIDMLLNWIEGRDPTPNNEYTQWLVQRYCDGGIHLLEDMFKAQDYLGQFHRLKTSGFFRRRTADAEHAQWLRQMSDIGSFKTLSDLGSFVMDQGQQAISNAAQERALKAKAIEESEILHDGPKYMVVIPSTMEASQYWGRNTQWCTAAKENNYFDHYQDAPLYIIIDKKNNRRWQLYFEGFSPQFMDERDAPIVWTEFPADVWLAFDWPDEVFPTMILSARVAKDPEVRKAILRKLDNNQLITAYYWHGHDLTKRADVQTILKERAGSIRSITLFPENENEEIEGLGYDDEEETDRNRADGYTLGDLLVLLGGWSHNRFVDHHELLFHQIVVNEPSGADWTRPAENFETMVQSSKATVVEIDGRTWYCWRDGTRSDKTVTCVSSTDEMRIRRGTLGGEDPRTVYRVDDRSVMPHQDIWKAVMQWQTTDLMGARYTGYPNDYE